MNTLILLISCPDKKGITARVTQFIFSRGGNIIHADQHIDTASDTFFMRVQWQESGSSDPDGFREKFDAVAKEYCMDWEIFCSSLRPRVVLFVSKHLHCLYDLLWRYRAGQFNCEIPFIVSNHEEAEHAADSFGVGFHHVPVMAAHKADAEQYQLKLLKDAEIELVVLARYMQILSPEFISGFSYKIINIHHSFLPAFKGADPYRQAYEKGVKIIGATSHYVNDELDMGPIIEQDTVRVSHRDTVEDMVRKGQDLEKVVLSRAVSWHLQRKILTYNNKTVVFD